MKPTPALHLRSAVRLALTLAAAAATFADAGAQPAGGRGGNAPEIMSGRGPQSIAGLDTLTGNKDIPPGPYQPSWDSVGQHYQVPQWFRDGKFGIFMHWGVYSVPARQSEWYVRYIYGGNAGIMRDHVAKYGPLDKFGYKDFIPMFTAAKWDPDAWAALFKKAGARYVVPTAEHHDGFALWDSALTKIDAKDMGPHRDLIGDLAAAVRKQGLKFGVSNHRIEHFTFIRPPGDDIKTDLYDPEWADFYSVADRSDAARLRFLNDWLARNFELIDKYQPDMLWFDNGVNGRAYDPLKLRVAAYYYNRASQWGKQVSLSTKDSAYLAGSIMDYERQGRILPRELKDFAWQVDDPIGSKFGYVEEIQYKPADLLVHRLIDTVAMNGNYLLNISPRADGTIPQDQQDRLLAIGAWLDVNGEAIYGTRPWTRYGEGPYYDLPSPTGRGSDDPPGEGYTDKEFRFTVKGDALYAIAMAWPENGTSVVTSLPRSAGTVTKVELLGHPGSLSFTQDDAGLHVRLPAEKPCDFAFALKVAGVVH